MSELPQPGDIIGVRYRIETILGQGGMGAVFAAVNQATGRAVAIKWMLAGAARSQESVSRFLAEARATAKIEHPNVIQILDVGQDGAAPFLVMERLRGQSLADRLERHGRMSVEEMLSVIIPACRGVAEAHSEGIIHRDLKPDNIFLCAGKDGSPRPPKVLDFGISKLYDQEGGASLTQTGIAMGTPQYMSPEQLNAPPDADARFDVYAMGIVMYECLTGKVPYNADGLFELVQQIARGNPTPIRMVSPDVPADLEAVVMRAMAVHRDYRYATIQELIGELERVWNRIQSGAPPPQVPIGQIPSTAGVPSHGAGMYTPAPVSNAWTPQGGYSPATGAQYGYPPTGAQYPPSQPMMVQPMPQSGGSSSGMIIGIVVGAIVLLALIAGGIGAGAYFMGRDGGDDSTPPLGSGGGTDIGDPPSGGGTPSTNPRTPRVDVRFTGDCDARFTSRLMVTSSSGQVSVMSSGLTGVTGLVTMSFPQGTGVYNLSTQQRMDTQTLVNVMVGQRYWMNMTLDFAALSSGRIQDPITGRATVTEFDADLARTDVTFENVTVQNGQDGSLCTLNGRIQTFGVTYGS